ncbi:thioredoxin family protein, partial [Guyparkeria sp.]|uniref:thioredoxin family protein n=1 Tax=Guyparkeria sp. TaxID=2035736 RepID=UPI003970CB69
GVWVRGWLALAVWLLALPAWAQGAADPSDQASNEVRFVAHLADLPADFAWMREHERPMMLFFHASYCGYCQMIDEEFIIPMRLKPKYQGRLLIRRVQTDGDRTLVGTDGETWTHPDVAQRLEVTGVPYVLFIAPNGERIGSITGTAPDFYNIYLDRKVDLAERCAKDMSQPECREEVDEPGLPH